MPAVKLNGFVIEEHTALTASRLGRAGAIKTSVPAFSNATRRLMTSSRSVLPWKKPSARAVNQKGVPESSRCLDRRSHALGGFLDIEQAAFLPIATRRDILNRGANEADARCEPICLGNRDRCRSKAAFKVGGTGSSVASTIARALSKASSRVKARSRLPWTAADAQLDVARAGKPRAARIRAEPASQGLAVTNVGPCWSFANASAFSIWVGDVLVS